MKNRIYIVLFLLITGFSKGQYSASGVKSDSYEVFRNSKKVLVVLTGDKDADNQLKSAVSQNWTLKPVDYITSEELENKIADESVCFMLAVDIKDEHNMSYSFFTLLPGGKKKISRYSYDDLLAYCPIDKNFTELSTSQAAFRFPLMVASLQSVIEKVEKSGISGNKASLGNKFNEINAKNLAKIKTKTLLVNSAFGLSEKEIKEEYKYKFEVCDKNKIAEAIKNKDPKYVIFQQACSKNRFIFLFDTETYECIYSSTNMMGTKSKQKDIKEIIEQLKG